MLEYLFREEIRETTYLEIDGNKTDGYNIDFTYLNNFESLTHLEISNIKLTEFNVKIIASLQQLTELHLVNCNIGDCDAKLLSELVNLDVINLHGNVLTKVPVLNKQLSSITLTSNYIEDINDLKYYTYVEYIGLDDNKIKNLDVFELGDNHFINIDTLSLKNNLFDDAELKKLFNLNSIYGIGIDGSFLLNCQELKNTLLLKEIEDNF